jgi:transposase
VARSATGDPGSCDLREVVNALLYQNRTGRQWRLLPHDLPAWSAVFHYFTLWRQDGLDQRIQEILRCQVRERSRRLACLLTSVRHSSNTVVNLRWCVTSHSCMRSQRCKPPRSARAWV